MKANSREMWKSRLGILSIQEIGWSNGEVEEQEI